MPTYTKYIPGNEKELHGIIQRELDAIEEGLECLKYEFSTGKGTPDFLCVDSGGRLLIIEVKLREDENVLFQALRYFSLIDKDRYIIASMFEDKKIDPEQQPRIILIAERFSEDIKRLSTLVKPEIELLEYTVVIGSSGDKGIIFHIETLPLPEDPPSKPLGFSDHREYIRKESLKPVFDKMREDVKKVSGEIEEYVTQSYVGYKYIGKQIAWIRVFRQAVEIGASIIDEDRQHLDSDRVRLENGTVDYTDIIHKLSQSFVNMGGTLPE